MIYVAMGGMAAAGVSNNYYMYTTWPLSNFLLLFMHGDKHMVCLRLVSYVYRWVIPAAAC
jgi:hypothetical protein